MTPIPRRSSDDAGSALFSYGFRPFFLLAALYAAATMLVWLPYFSGEISLATALAPRDWHVHEFLFGYLTAAVAGFLLTAIPNWTGRFPLQGMPLIVLVAVWIAGRIAVTLSGIVGGAVAAVVDVAFLVLLTAAAGREIIAGKNWRNLKVLLPVGILAAANIGFHAEAGLRGTADYSLRGAAAAFVLLIMLIGGRVIPSFTRNWLARNNPGRLPAPFARFDAVAIILSAAALVLWTVLPDGMPTALGLLVASLLQAARLVRWAGDRTLADRLVAVLHVGYAFIPVGFLLTAMAAMGLVLPSAGLHAWLAGAAGMMTLAVMTRATLGHTGRDLSASWITQAIYGAAFVAAVARIAAAITPDYSMGLLHVAWIAWVVAFGGFAAAYGPMLVRPRLAPPQKSTEIQKAQ